MDFLKRKVSRIGLSLVHYKVIIKLKSLEVSLSQPGEVFVLFKRGRHVENSERLRVQVIERQCVKVDFADCFARVSDFYRSSKDGQVQSKFAIFQVFFQPEGQATPVKLNSTQVNLASFVGRGSVTERLAMGGDAHFLTFEALVEEGSAGQKTGPDSDDEDDEQARLARKHGITEANVRIVEVVQEHPVDENLKSQNLELGA